MTQPGQYPDATPDHGAAQPYPQTQQQWAAPQLGTGVPGPAYAPPSAGGQQPGWPTQPPKKAGWKRKRVLIPAGILALTVVAAATNGGSKDADSASASASVTSTAAPAPVVDAESVVETSTPASVTTVAPVPTTPAPVTPSLAIGQSNALRTAADYLDYTSFSRSGLMGQLEFEGFSTDDATFAVDTLGVDWNAQAAAKAQEYLDYTSFSRSGLVDQLVYEGFSPEEAEFGVTAVGF